MEKEKSFLLLCPYQLKSGQIWEVLHSEKNKGAITYNTEPLSPAAIEKYFRVSATVAASLTKFSVKQLRHLRSEVSGIAATSGDDLFELNVHRNLMALKPLLPSISCYHKTRHSEKHFRTSPCYFSAHTPTLRFQLRKSPQGYYYVDSEVGLNGAYYPLAVFRQSGFLLEDKNEYFILRYGDYKTLSWLQELDWCRVGRDPDHFSENVLAKLEEDYTVSRNGFLPSIRIEAEPTKRVLLNEINSQFLMLTPQFDYDGFVIEGTFQDTTSVRRNGKQYLIIRNREAEAAITDELRQLHPKFCKQINGYFYLSYEDARHRHWFLKTFRQLLQLDFQVIGLDMLKHFRYCTEKPVTTLRFIDTEKHDVIIDFSLSFSGENIPFPELQKIVRAGQQTLPLKDGSIAVLDEGWMSEYGTIVKHALGDKHRMRLPKWVVISLEQSSSAGQKDAGMLKKDWLEKWKQWQQANEPLYPVPAAVRAAPRMYQQKGFEWLMLLNEIDAGMFLADDMGLGKTLQAICFLAHLHEARLAGKSLVVSPASLIYNWQHEFGKFAPSIPTTVYHGPSRDDKVFSDESTRIIITSYGTLRSESARFLSQAFLAVVLDESHAIKNPDSQVAAIVHSLNCNKRIALSGTPVMNNTFDLYSQMQFVLPGLFGSKSFFKREYADPIDRDKDPRRMAELQKLTAPFILRRTKEQVARDLPPKTEVILWCEMNEAQRRVYEEVKSCAKADISQAIHDKGIGQSKFQVLQSILRLRQACNSPALLPEAYHGCTESVKTRELLEEIENNLSHHKLLVFSQFTAMLDLLAEELVKKGIPFLMLTGETPPMERDRMVRTFNDDDGSPAVFLLSLKAGNAGLNLTAADYVFLFDPWWNNAVEQQAIDRTHRIGQTKNVFAYKLVCKNTIEEKIIQLQQLKKQLSGSLIVEEEAFVKTLTEDDIAFLFE